MADERDDANIYDECADDLSDVPDDLADWEDIENQKSSNNIWTQEILDSPHVGGELYRSDNLWFLKTDRSRCVFEDV
ncbi:hypothetical protein M0802_011316 [Mischocyttarus mexicanus]|nr:hypothetical protein M0802_011316 [Mischocyttarus mexicanus]